MNLRPRVCKKNRGAGRLPFKTKGNQWTLKKVIVSAMHVKKILLQNFSSWIVTLSYELHFDCWACG